MLPLHQSQEISIAIEEYLKATFGFQEARLNKAFQDFLKDPDQGIFKGPYVSLKPPFVKAEEDAILPLTITPPFSPFLHQLQAFERLSGEHPQPTILTTGTGSGKTEAFLYPLLDYCYQNRHRRGIKAIILYPMNALATDQAKRLAESIWENKLTKGVVRAGLFIGLGKDTQNERYRAMGETHIIESRREIVNDPPDILLTNFKMLDLALMQSQYVELWNHNVEAPDLLQFLVLDELHTYDGAQGTDVANLIRRMKLKIGLEEGQLCPVGTSATIGSGADSKRLLAEYTSKVFGEHFDESCIIEEHRQSLDEFFNQDRLDDRLPDVKEIEQTIFDRDDNYQAYLKDQCKLWGIDPTLSPYEMGLALKELQILYDILSISSKSVISIKALLAQLENINPNFQQFPKQFEYKGQDYHSQEELLKSIFSLISYAKLDEANRFPFLYLQIQLWLRELSGIQRYVQEEAEFVWAEEESKLNENAKLPPYFCRDCGASGWLGYMRENEMQFRSESSLIFNAYFGHSKDVYFINSMDQKASDEYDNYGDPLERYLDPQSLDIYTDDYEGTLPIVAYRNCKKNKEGKIKGEHVCPSCNSRNSIALIGTRVASLSSVAVSQLLATDLEGTSEKDRKVLAFSNTVQDAAHYAGFIQARNYRFTFRTALQQVIQKTRRTLTLTQLQQQFIEYWKEHAADNSTEALDAYFYKFFPSDKIGEIKIDRYKQKQGGFEQKFIEEFDRRMSWNINSEFGYNAVIGRTLEKTGTAAAFIEASLLRTSFEMMLPWLDKNNLNNLGEDEFLRFLAGFLHRLRIRGGVDHPYLHKFRSEKSNYYLITQNTNKGYYFMQNFGKRSRLPKLITDSRSNKTRVFDRTARIAANMNWFHAYFIKSFTWAREKEVELINEFYSQLLEILSNPELNILNKKVAEGIDNYAFNPEAIKVNTNVQHYECDKCEHCLTTTTNMRELDAAACIQFRCTGKYRPIKKVKNYYQDVYNRERVIRIYAGDHTGLLDRSDRERLEVDFKERPRHNSKNSLVATSTLEMGIDIGDLNNTINMSIPPLPSNFLQRIGRAGRKSGSAFVLNFSANKPHDLYYYEDPMEMMAGEVNTPGCYLEAKDILRRHFIAFCLDCWSSFNPTKNYIPRRIRSLAIHSLHKSDESLFLNRIIKFIQDTKDSIWDAFSSQYQESYLQETLNDLKNELLAGGIYRRISAVYDDVKQQYDHFDQQKREILDLIDALPKTDPRIEEELNPGLRAIGKAYRDLDKSFTLIYLTNIGLLPNYAFPETGVTLSPSVRVATGSNEEGKSEYEMLALPPLVRPAKSAIRELAPGQHFYTQGFKLPVTGIRVMDWNDEVKEMRYCSNCDYLAPETIAPKGNCPKCGDRSWRELNNKHKFLKFKSAISYTDSKESMLDDSSDERQMIYNSTSKHFDVSDSNSQGAYVHRRVSFGMELLKSVHFREVNTGTKEGFGQDGTKINEIEHSSVGFAVCKHCGKATDKKNPNTNNRFYYHFGFCKNRDQSYKGVPDQYFEEVYLYREMTTEALKILLPVQELDSEAQVRMFKAGLMLGLRKFYQGNPAHLRLLDYAEYNQQMSKKDRFLLILDEIPGGTGYLAKLFDPEVLNEVLELAYQEIANCACQLQGRDGCYQCIYTYTNQYHRKQLSRSEAEKIFKDIVGDVNDWTFEKYGFRDTRNNGQVEESELEKRFVHLLKEYLTPKRTEKNPDTFFETSLAADKLVYNLKLYNYQERVHYFYQMVPEVDLDSRQGVELHTRPDFILYCTDIKKDNQSVEGAHEAIPPIAVYLDGYQYHASKENNRFPGDYKKRQAINASNHFLTWTLGWKDLELFEASMKEDVKADEVEDDIYRSFNQKILAHPLTSKLAVFNNMDEHWLFQAKNNMFRFIGLLKNSFHKQSIKNYLNQEVQRILFFCQKSILGLSIQKTDYGNLPSSFNEDIASYQMPSNLKSQILEGYSTLDQLYNSPNLLHRIFIEINQPKNGDNGLKLIGALAITKDKERGEWDKISWENFWRIFNLLQYQENIDFLIEGVAPIVFNEKKTEEEDSFDEILEEFEEEYHKLVTKLLTRNIDFNKDEYFALNSEDGEILAEAILGLEKHKIIVEPLDEDCEKLFKKQHYKILSIEELLEIIDTL
jgi:DEAD/DEAH box helicase domain-containing protein